MKRRVRTYHGYVNPSKRVIGKMASTPAPCSCFMCRNPRRNGEIPVSEQRRLAALADEENW